jgi:hypothetical protein
VNESARDGVGARGGDAIRVRHSLDSIRDLALQALGHLVAEGGQVRQLGAHRGEVRRVADGDHGPEADAAEGGGQVGAEGSDPLASAVAVARKLAVLMWYTWQKVRVSPCCWPELDLSTRPYRPCPEMSRSESYM